MRIEIVNWEKYNPRGDVKHTTWFRVQNTFWVDLFAFDSDTKVVWIVLLALASQKMQGEIEVDFDFISANLRLPVATVESAIGTLLASGIIREPTSRHASRARHATRHAHVPPRQTDRQTDRRVPRTPLPGGDPHPLDFAFAEDWATYAKEVSPTVKPDLAKWTHTVHLLKSRDGVTEEQLLLMLDFVRTDDFWRDKAASLEGLRSKSKNGLRKFENILAAMKNRRPPERPREKIPVISSIEEYECLRKS